MSAITSLDGVGKAIEQSLVDCKIEKIQSLPVYEQPIRLAQGIQALEAALTDEVMDKVFMPLQGKKLGFLTDRDNKMGPDGKTGYSREVVRTCLVDCFIRGFLPVGNEMNIIAEGPYYTKAALRRKVMEFPGLTEYKPTFSVPHLVGEKGALVSCTLRYKLNGKPEELSFEQKKDGPDERIPIKVNSGMGSDAILGKARRKADALLLEHLMGVTYAPTDGDALDTEGEVVPDGAPTSKAKSAVDDMVGKHEAGKGGDAKNGIGNEPTNNGKGGATPASSAKSSAQAPAQRDPGQEG